MLYNYCSKYYFWSVSVRTRKPAHSLSCVFWLGHFSRSKISFESSFLIRFYNYCLKKIGSVLVRSRKPALSFSGIFWLMHFLRSKISFESSFLIKWYIITELIFIWIVSVRTRKSALLLSCVFVSGALPKVKNQFWKQFSNKWLCNNWSKKNWVFWSKPKTCTFTFMCLLDWFLPLMTDSTLKLTDSTLLLIYSILIMTDSTLWLINSTLIMTDSTITVPDSCPTMTYSTL